MRTAIIHNQPSPEVAAATGRAPKPRRGAQAAPAPRAPKPNAKGEIEVPLPGAVPVDQLADEDNMFNPGDLAQADGTEKPPAVDYEDIEENPGPPVLRYRVVKGGRVQTQRNGQRTLVNAGKELDGLNFDIALMRTQGIEFEEIASG